MTGSRRPDMGAKGSTIRYAMRGAEPAAYLALFETTGWNGIYRCREEDLEASLRSSWFVVTAYHDDELVGTGRLVSDGVLYAIVFDMIVAPDWQGRGIGSAILRRLLDRCSDAGIRDVLLFAARGVEGFYRRHGFVPRPEEAPGMILRRVSAGDGD